MNKWDVLSRCELFKQLDDRQLDIISRECNREVFEPGASLTKQDAEELKLYVIEEGLVAIVLECGLWSHRQVQAASSLEVVGWSAMLEPYISTATVKAIEKTTTLAFDGKYLHDLCIRYPSIGCHVSRGLARVVTTRLRNAYSQLIGVTSQI